MLIYVPKANSKFQTSIIIDDFARLLFAIEKDLNTTEEVLAANKSQIEVFEFSTTIAKNFPLENVDDLVKLFKSLQVQSEELIRHIEKDRERIEKAIRRSHEAPDLKPSNDELVILQDLK